MCTRGFFGNDDNFELHIRCLLCAVWCVLYVQNTRDKVSVQWEVGGIHSRLIKIGTPRRKKFFQILNALEICFKTHIYFKFKEEKDFLCRLQNYFIAADFEVSKYVTR